MDSNYKPEMIEPKWQQRWRERGTFELSDAPSEKPAFYVLEMFPYPSGHLHMGHVRNYSIGDVIARVKRARGYDVLHPIGWDAFGLPAENAARKNNDHPARWTYANIESMKAQLQKLGFSYDWSRELATCDPDYYRWEQAVFLDLLEKGLAYKKSGLLNWCESCKTTLANEQVEDGSCWRCDGPVVQKELDQWYLRITDYAQELLDFTDKLPGWPGSVTTQQRAWIGRSVGASILFDVEGAEGIEGVDGPLEVFTTRPDTLYGCTFMSLAPEHPWTRRLAAGTEQEAAVNAFVDEMGRVDRAERMADDTEKRGVFTGRYATNPVNGERVAIWTANFVLADYGTGAVMAVPAHDQRDFEFATVYGIPKRVVIRPEDGEAADPAEMTEAFVDPGIMVHSGAHDGTPSPEGKATVIAELESLGKGDATVNFRLRDWGISRQRYWGCPVPVVYCDACGMVPVPRDQLPVVLPLDVALGADSAGSPLQDHPEFLHTSCPNCGGDAHRETDTFDTFMESSWYYLRYTSPHFEGGMVDPAQVKRFLPVGQYIGGVEHAVMHLLYARFYTKVLRDLGVVELDEPFENLLTQGMVCHESYKLDGEWLYPHQVTISASADVERTAVHAETGAPVQIGRVEKMSKSKLNTVDPNALIARYGADTARLFCLFAAPPEKDLDWSEDGVAGAYRFLKRVWRLVADHADALRGAQAPLAEPEGAVAELRRTVHKTIARATDDIERRLQLNTAIAAQMELVNALYRFVAKELGQPGAVAEVAVAVDALLRLLSPFAPHIADELWVELGKDGLVEEQPWPEAEERWTKDDLVTLAVQVMGKLRGTIEVDADAGDDVVREAALALPRVAAQVDGKTIRRVIHVKGRLVNIVAN